MDKATFEKIISSPASISSEEAVLLEELVQEFPYCQMAHLLIANESYQKKSMHYPKKLRKASTYILDRTVLHTLLHHKEIDTPSEIILTIHDPEIKHEQEQQKEDDTAISKKNVEILKEIEQNLSDLKRKKEELKNLKIIKDLPDLNKKKVVNALELPFNESKFGEELSSGEITNIDLLLDYLQKNHLASGDHIEGEDITNQSEIIDKFIVAQPKLSPRSSIDINNVENSDLAVDSTELKLELITENYALILTKQNKIEKAIEVYKKLLLKYPDKSAYFALKLNELESR